MLSFINSRILGPLLPVFLFACGAFLLIKLSFKPFRKPGRMIRAFKGNNSKESFKAACLSLSGTLGVGNIAGVASAIGIGGAGAVFWMWVFAFMAMIIKYAEVVLAMRYKKFGVGGAAEYIRHGLKKPLVASLFSILILVSSIGVGNTVQSSAAAESMKVCFGVPSIFTGIIFSVITLLMIYGGRKRIESVSSIIIPILSLGYIVVSLAIITSNLKMIPAVITEIIDNAFDPVSAGGGAFGFLFTSAIRLGASRGILSNEAGCGTAAYAHQTESHPAEQGIWGIFEVFVDTILLCTMTAFVVLVTPETPMTVNGIAVALSAYGHYGYWLRQFIGISTAIYALASVVCWSYYGISSIKHLGGKRNSRRLYLWIYSMAGIMGSVFAPSLVWEISDFTVSVMAIINTTCVILLWREVRASTDEYFV